jgi:hypothetical protein
MAAINQQEAARFSDLEWLDNGIEFALKFFTKIAEIVLLIGVGYAGYKLAHRGPSNETLDQVWIVSQILALDLSAPGLFAMVKQARDSGQVERASWARRIAVILIVMSILSMVEGAVEYFLPGMSKDVITWASLLMMIARCGAAVGYSVFCRLQKAERATQLAIQPTQSPTQPAQDERIDELSEAIQTLHNRLSTVIEAAQNSVSLQQPTHDLHTIIKPLQLKTVQAQTGLRLLTMAATATGMQEDEQEQEPALEADTAAQLVNYPVVPGVSAEKVRQIIDAHLSGVKWRAIPGNYSQTIKLVRDAWESLHSDLHTSLQEPTQPKQNV